MKRDGGAPSRWTGFWARLRDDVVAPWHERPAWWREQREQWRETTAEIRERRQHHRGMNQRLTGLKDPTRRQVRRALREQREDDWRGPGPQSTCG